MYPTLFCAIASPSLNGEQFNSVEVQNYRVLQNKKKKNQEKHARLGSCPSITCKLWDVQCKTNTQIRISQYRQNIAKEPGSSLAKE